MTEGRSNLSHFLRGVVQHRGRDVARTGEGPDNALQIEKQLLAGKGNCTIRKVLGEHTTEVVGCLHHVVRFVEFALPRSVECFVGGVVVTNSPVVSSTYTPTTNSMSPGKRL